jgi:co-chaperonin GroES (HSP10)
MKPTTGWTLIESRQVGGSGLVGTDGESLGGKKENVVVAVSPKDTVEWKKGDMIALGEGAKGFNMDEDGKKYVLIANSSIIAIL